MRENNLALPTSRDTLHPFPLFERLSRWMDDMAMPDLGMPMPRLGGGTFPAVDNDADNKKVTVQIAAPGLDPNKLDVTLEGRTLRLSGELEAGDANALPPGYMQAKFSQAMTLPCEVNAKKVKTKAKNGLITLTLPRLEHKMPKRIKIR